MNRKTIIGIIGVLALIAFMVFKLKSNKTVTEQKVYQYNKEQPINVTTEKISLQSIGSDFSFSGTFEPNRESKLSAETQGKINAIYTDLGAYVSKGQRLVQLDNALLQQQLNTIHVQIQNAKIEYEVQLNANQIQIEGLKQDVQRYKVLAQADAIQGVQLEKAELQLKTAENQRIAILQQSGLKTAEAQRKSIEEQIHKTTITAPFGGIITAKLNEIGSFAAPGVPLLQLSEISVLRFTVNVSEKDLPHFRLGQVYQIKSDALPTTSLIGKISMIGSKSNMGSSFPVQFMVSNTANNAIKAGMFGKVEIGENSDEKGIVIPSNVVIGTAEHPQVYTVKSGKATLTNITISKRTKNKAVVATGLQEGDIIVTNGFINLFEGAKISQK